MKYDNLAVRNSHMWLLIKYDNKTKAELKNVYGSVIKAIESIAAQQDKYTPEVLDIMLDNLECLNYFLCTQLGVPIDVQIKMMKEGLVG